MTENKKHTVYLGIGSNMDGRESLMREGLEGIQQYLGNINSVSKIYETAAWGITNQNSFLNQVVKIETSLDPEELMHNILLLEKKMGRIREEKWGPRRIDIDILFYDDIIINNSQLQIPHPQMHLRKFVLVPLNEIAPEIAHPLFEKNIKQLLLECPDQLDISIFNTPK